MICDLHQKTLPTVDGFSSSLSPPPTPADVTTSNFLTSSHQSEHLPITTTTFVTTGPSASIEPIHTTTTTTKTTTNNNNNNNTAIGGKGSHQDSVLKFNFNIPHFIPTDASLTTQEITNSSECVSLPSPASSPSEPEVSFLGLPESSSVLLSPPPGCSAGQQDHHHQHQHRNHPYYQPLHSHQHHHHDHRHSHSHLRPHSPPPHRRQQQQQHQQRQDHFQPEDLPKTSDIRHEELLYYIDAKGEELFLNEATTIDIQPHHHNTRYQFNTNRNNNNSSNNNNNNNALSNASSADIYQKDCTGISIITKEEPEFCSSSMTNISDFSGTSNFRQSEYPNHIDIVGTYHFGTDMSRAELTTDINNNDNSNNNNDDNNNSSSNDIKMSPTTIDYNEEKNDFSGHDIYNEFNFLPASLMTSLNCQGELSSCDNANHNDNYLSFFDLDNFSAANVEFSDIPDTCSDYEDSNPRNFATEEALEGFSQLLDTAQPNTRELLFNSYSIANGDIAYLGSSGCTSGDDISEPEVKVQRLDHSPSFFNTLLHNSCPGSNDHPHSPTSDEGFEDGPSAAEDPENLPFNGNFLEPIDAEVAATVETKKRQRKRQNPLKPRKKIAVATPSPTGERRKPGRKPGQVSNVLHLWEFMRDLLNEPTANGDIIEWLSQSEGVFRVVKSAEVARLWGEKKNNKKAMTYEKLSRSLRYSRLEGYFVNLPDNKNYPKKLCFKFGPKSKDWSLNLKS